jgi:S1-C subfamily serine protease
MLAPNEPISPVVKSADDGLLPGVVMRIINPAVQTEFDLDWTTQGILVIDPGRVAPQIGLRQGDIILAVNGNTLDQPGQFDDLLRQSNRTGSITVLRQGRKIQLRFRI